MFDPFLDNHIVSFGRFQLVMYDGWYDHIDDHHDGQNYSLNIGVGHTVEGNRQFEQAVHEACKDCPQMNELIPL